MRKFPGASRSGAANLLVSMVVLAAAARTHAGDAPALRFDFGVPGTAIEYDAKHPIFELHSAAIKDDPADRTLAPADFGTCERRERHGAIELTWTQPPSPWPSELRVVVVLRRVEHEVEAQLSLDSPGGTTIPKVRFPAVHVPTTELCDTLLMSHPMGDAMYYPRRDIGGRLGGECVYRYPATLAMQYMVFYNEARSYYLSAYSTGDETFEHSARNQGDGMRLSCVWYPFLERGQWQSPPCGLAVLPGGWHAAADLYRSRMGRVFRPPAPPAWMRESFHGWGQVSFKGARTEPAFRFTDIPKLYAQLEAIGLNTLHIFSWERGGMDNDYPLRFPSPNCGTVDELRAAMDAVRARGGHVILYTNGRLIDPNSRFYTEMGGDACIALDDDGTAYEEFYTRKFYVACPAATVYQDVLVDNFRRIVTEYRAHAAQIDQTACTPGVFCFACPEHGHRTPATNFLAPTDRLLRRIHDYYRAADPEFFVWVEGLNERFGQYYEVNQSHGEEGTWTVGNSLPEQFRYTYPDYIITGIADGIPALCHTFGQGKPFDFHWRRLGDPDWTSLITRLVAVRKALPDYFLRGRFLDTVGLECSGRDVRCWRIDRTDRPGTLVNLWARGRDLRDRATASLRLPHTDWLVRGAYPGDLRITRDGTWFVCEWTGPVATLVAEPTAAPP